MTEHREQLRADQIEAAARGGADRELLTMYLRDAATSDVLHWRPEDLTGAVLSHRDLAARRSPGQVLVRVTTPTVEADAWATGNTVIEVVIEDMPFLVDSVVGALDRRGLRVVDFVHPQMPVERDEDGTLTRVLTEEQRDSLPDEQVLRESWMHIQVPRVADAEGRREIEELVRETLADVRAAVTDWEPMVTRAQELLEHLDSHPPQGLDAREVTRAVDVLRWFTEGHFTFLGYRHYALEHSETPGEELLRPTDDGLGLLAGAPAGEAESGACAEDEELAGAADGDGSGEGPDHHRARRLTGAAAAKAREKTLLFITKANSRSTVHRQAHMDYIGVKEFDENGEVIGEHRFLGLLTAAAYTSSVREVPYVRDKVAEVVARSGFTKDSHLAKDLLSVLEGYPRDDLFQASVEDLARIATETVRLRERPGTRIFLRPDVYGRFMSALVFLPRDRYTTAVRERVQTILLDALGGDDIDYATQVGDGPLARMHIMVRVPGDAPLPQVDEGELQERVVAAVRTWDEALGEALLSDVGEDATARLTSRYLRGLPEAYKEMVGPRVAVSDLLLAEKVEDDGKLHLTVTHLPGARPGERRLKLASSSRLSLTRMLPLLTNLGVEVTDESTYKLSRREEDGSTQEIHLYDVGVIADEEQMWRGGRGDAQDAGAAVRNFGQAFAAAWDGSGESDALDSLVLGAGMTPRQVTILRALAAYVRQTSLRFTRQGLEEALLGNVGIVREIIDLFAARFDPDAFDEPDGTPGEERRVAVENLSSAIAAALDDVASLDHDLALRAVRDVVLATDRTSAYRELVPTEEGRERSTLTLKIKPERIDHLRPPLARVENWVYSPRVEGVHFRYGMIARGGLRWSDRRDDFRTEVSGLAKAQMLKNAVIVPAGAKGGFFPKQLPDPSVDRDAWLAEGQGSYREFIAALLDVTDNLDGNESLHPPRVVRWDEPDNYLVVAADKGTASFSDLANAISSGRDFWLDDAFASGGSAGYSHKGMGITARGAWESVKRHFRELGVDTQSEDFTVVGIGDMSGDVFGNGMLLSEHIRLVAAFDHRHIFLDPDPDAATSFAERKRLFELPRSSWADYDTSLISEGGGVHPRTAKTVPISAQVREALGLGEEVTVLSPNELVRAVLQAPVDLLWNGGIGTYVKATTETHQDAADRASDAFRIDAADLRVKVVGEGGNLGLTQRGRIEAALHGIKLNTDAIDNSAGVATSDVEVNLKILLGRVERAGDLTRKQRNDLLVEMTEDVAAQVLRINYEQNVLLGNARMQDQKMVGPHLRLMAWLEQREVLDRQVDALPSDEELQTRADELGKGLTSPEFSVLVAATKNALKTELDASDLPDDPWFGRELHEYFPAAVRERFPEAIDDHPLRRQIIAMTVANSIVNRGGISFVHRAVEETSASIVSIARAFVVAREILHLREFVEQVEALDNKVPTDLQGSLYLDFRRLLERAVRWFLHNRSESLDVGKEIETFGPSVRFVRDNIGELLRGEEATRYEARHRELVEAGVPEELARISAGVLELYSGLDVGDLAVETGASVETVAPVYHGISELVGIDRLLTAASNLPGETRWEALARAALRDDLYLVNEELTRAVLAETEEDLEPDERVRLWAVRHEETLGRAHATAEEALSGSRPVGMAQLSVVLRSLRSVARSVGAN